MDLSFVSPRPPAAARVPRRPLRVCRVAGVETLEGRRLLCALTASSEGPHELHAVGAAAVALTDAGVAAAFSAKVNFQPATAAVPGGYAADVGAAFGDRGNGLSYGWDAANTSARDRNNALSPDQRYDTFTHTQLYGTRTWNLAVPAPGTYVVRIVAGEPSNYNSVYGFDAEGVSVAAGRPTSAARWVDGTRSITVTDGRLTVSNSAGASNNKIAFIEVASGTVAPVAVSVTAADPSAAEAGAEAGRFQFTRTGPTDAALTVTYAVGGTATSGSDYAALAGTVTIPAGAASATVSVVPRSDGVVEADETVTVTVAVPVGAGYAAGSPSSATLTIDDADDAPPAAGPLFQWQTKRAAPLARFEGNGAAVGGRLYVFGGYYNSAIQATARSDAYDPAADAWTRLPDMPAGYTVTHAGVAVDGGDVYLAGGYVGDHPGLATAQVWRFDTRTSTWHRLVDLPQPRAGGGLALVGRELHFFGGMDLRRENDHGDHWALSLDAATLGWEARAPLPNPRNHLGATTLGGKVYAIGGQHHSDEWTGNQASAQVYDPATNQWAELPPLPRPRSHVSSSTFVMNGRIVVAGGTGDGNVPLADVAAYDPAARGWVKLPSLPAARKTPVAGAVGGRIVVATGNSSSNVVPTTSTWVGTLQGTWDRGPSAPIPLAEVAGGVIGGKLYLVGEGNGATLSYDLARGTWSSSGALAQRPYKGNHHAAEVVNGKLYLFGGLGSGSEGKVQVYDPRTNRWTLGANMPFAAGSSSSAVIAGKAYVAGGIVGMATTNRLARYDPAANAWKELAPMPQGRNHTASGSDGIRFYVFGGRGPGSGDHNTVANGFDTVQIYNPGRNIWFTSAASTSSLRPLPVARGGMGKAVFHNGEFYVLGGETLSGSGATADRVYSRVDVYNPARNTWRLGAAPMPTARHGIFPLLYAGRVYVAAGGVKAGASSSAVLEVLNLV